MQTVLIDTFIVPAEAVSAFLERTKTIQSFLRTLPGFVEGYLYEKSSGEGRYNFVTTAVWSDDKAVESAKTAMVGEFQRLNFNPQEFRQKLRIEAERAVYRRTSY